jgi:hypothetical protein
MIINCMAWFFAFLSIFYALVTKSKWVTTSDTVFKMTRTQEAAIYYVKKADELKQDIFKVKKMSTSNAFKLQNLIDCLTE